MKEVGFIYIWRYDVLANRLDDFLKHYRSEGEWVKLFKNHDGFISTFLFADPDISLRYYTLDSWKSKEHRDEFRKVFKVEFDLIDSICDEMTMSEELIGEYEILPISDRFFNPNI